MRDKDWTLPKKELIKKETVIDSIYTAIKEQKITYPAEIVGITGLNRQTVFDKLAYMTRRNMVEKIDVSTKREPPEKLKERLPELWGKGLKGEVIRRMSWYQINDGVKE